QLLHELKKLGPNLNQIAHQANSEGLSGIEDKANFCLDAIADILINLKKRSKDDRKNP
ncbi:MAG: plasmid mobilization relaxosome protein MobC, partial [Muribaculaceae bacterium]|nr:plasmid mobilization relaxosome protein MobC [Muribaculaceae bacterium]